jgi:hypothetical protein
VPGTRGSRAQRGDADADASITGRTVGATLYWKYSYQGRRRSRGGLGSGRGFGGVAAAARPRRRILRGLVRRSPAGPTPTGPCATAALRWCHAGTRHGRGTHTLTGNLAVPVTCATSGAYIIGARRERRPGPSRGRPRNHHPAESSTRRRRPEGGLVDSDTVAEVTSSSA